jgi:hypothetical protein
VCIYRPSACCECKKPSCLVLSAGRFQMLNSSPSRGPWTVYTSCGWKSVHFAITGLSSACPATCPWAESRLSHIIISGCQLLQPPSAPACLCGGHERQPAFAAAISDFLSARVPCSSAFAASASACLQLLLPSAPACPCGCRQRFPGSDCALPSSALTRCTSNCSSRTI